MPDTPDHSQDVTHHELPEDPPVDGSKLPPITGDVKITMAADGMVSKPPPPITGSMAVTEPVDTMKRRKKVIAITL